MRLRWARPRLPWRLGVTVCVLMALPAHGLQVGELVLPPLPARRVPLVMNLTRSPPAALTAVAGLLELLLAQSLPVCRLDVLPVRHLGEACPAALLVPLLSGDALGRLPPGVPVADLLPLLLSERVPHLARHAVSVLGHGTAPI